MKIEPTTISIEIFSIVFVVNTCMAQSQQNKLTTFSAFQKIFCCRAKIPWKVGVKFNSYEITYCLQLLLAFPLVPLTYYIKHGKPPVLKLLKISDIVFNVDSVARALLHTLPQTLSVELGSFGTSALNLICPSLFFIDTPLISLT